jgi:hypothetical protein
MPSSDHASGAVSRKAQRLDTGTRHGILLHAHLKVSERPFASPFLLLSLIPLHGGLDIESLSFHAWWQTMLRVVYELILSYSFERSKRCSYVLIIKGNLSHSCTLPYSKSTRGFAQLAASRIS